MLDGAEEPRVVTPWWRDWHHTLTPRRQAPWCRATAPRCHVTRSRRRAGGIFMHCIPCSRSRRAMPSASSGRGRVAHGRALALGGRRRVAVDTRPRSPRRQRLRDRARSRAVRSRRRRAAGVPVRRESSERRVAARPRSVHARADSALRNPPQEPRGAGTRPCLSRPVAARDRGALVGTPAGLIPSVASSPDAPREPSSRSPTARHL